jgi:hypothetical protein
MVRGLAVVGLSGAALLLGAASGAMANHVAGATYTGTHSGGAGAVEFDVSPDGTAITRFKVTNVPGVPSCTITERTFTGSVPISNHSFTRSPPGTDVNFSGSFPSSGSAQGTLQASGMPPPPCVSAPNIAWTATTSTGGGGGDGGGGGGGTGGGGGSGAGGGGGGGNAQYDLAGPNASLFGRTVQRAGRFITVGVICRNEPCNVTGQGSVNVPGTRTARRFRLRPARASIRAGGRRTLRLRVPTRALRAIRRALRKRRRVAARVTVTARDAAGNRTVRRRTIRLRR